MSNLNESGIGIITPLFFVGVVENNVDPRLEGRVQVRAFNIHGSNIEVPTIDLPWAICIQGTYDMSNKPPAINSWVFGFFIDGRAAQQPMLLGFIPTQLTQFNIPQISGYGSIPLDMEVSAQGSRPQDIGQPSVPRTARGEDLVDTHVLSVNATSVDSIPMPASYRPDDQEVVWKEPGSAYDAQYPHNKVLETASGHSIEYDDTPGAERILIYHRTGSFVQIDSRGTTTNKVVGDKYDINNENMCVYVGGRSMVSIQGDSVIYVGGNVVQEVQGDMNLQVHGDFTLNAGGKIEMVAGDAILNKAPSFYAQADSDKIILLSQGGTDISSVGPFTLKSNGIAVESVGMTSLKSQGDLSLGSSGVTNLKSGGNIAMDGAQIHMNSGHSVSPASVSDVEANQMQTPVAKSPPGSKIGNPNNRGPLMSYGVQSVDDVVI